MRKDLICVLGRGSGVVIATGTDTEFGVIFSMMQDVRTCFCRPFSHAQLELWCHRSKKSERRCNSVWTNWRRSSPYCPLPSSVSSASSAYYKIGLGSRCSPSEVGVSCSHSLTELIYNAEVQSPSLLLPFRKACLSSLRSRLHLEFFACRSAKLS